LLAWLSKCQITVSKLLLQEGSQNNDAEQYKAQVGEGPSSSKKYIHSITSEYTKCSHSTHIHTGSAKEPQDPFSHCPTDIVRSSSLV